MMKIIGIDPGLDGAIAELTEAGELVAIHDMPTLEDGAKGRRAVNPGPARQHHLCLARDARLLRACRAASDR